MKRLFRAVWTDKSLLLVLVPIAFLLTAVVANRSATDDVERTSATSSTTTTTVAANGTEEAVSEVPQPTYAPESFAAGGRTVTDDNGNLVRIPNGVGGSTGAAPYSGVAQVAGASQENPTTTPDDATTTVPDAATTTDPNASTTTVPTSTTTTLPREPTPVVSESPIGVLLPVSAIGVVGVGWIALSVRRRKRPAAAAGSSS